MSSTSSTDAAIRSDEGRSELFDVARPLPVRDYLASLWRRRDFVVLVPLGRLRAQTGGTTLGGLWHLLNPLLFSAVYYFVFGVIFQGARGIDNYAGFLLVGLFSFLYTQRSMTSGAGSVVRNRSLVGQVNFPRSALPLSSVIAETVSHGWAMLALFVLVVATGEPVTFAWLLVLPIIALQALFNLGLTFFAARAAFHFRDIEQFLPYILRMVMYLSGIFFSIDFVADRLGSDSVFVTLFRLNPVYAFASLTRAALMESVEFLLYDWVVAGSWSVVLLVAGFLYFRRREVEYASE